MDLCALPSPAFDLVVSHLRPGDIAMIRLASSRLLAAIERAPVHLRHAARARDPPRAAGPESLPVAFPQAASLELRGALLPDLSCAAACEGLRALRRLDLCGCTRAGGRVALAASRHPSLQVAVFMQCIALRPEFFPQLLASGLNGVMLRHDGLHASRGLLPDRGAPRLRAIALHGMVFDGSVSCSLRDFLAALGSGAPLLEFLGLGGARFDPSECPMEESVLQAFRHLSLVELTFAQGSLSHMPWREGVGTVALSSEADALQWEERLQASGDMVEKALAKSAANCATRRGVTPLHVAARLGLEEHTRALLSLGADPEARDGGNATPLFLACEAGAERVVERLVEAGAPPTIANSVGEAPAYIAALKGHSECASCVIATCRQQRLDWAAGWDNWSPLHAACVAGRRHSAEVVARHAEEEGCLAELANRPNRYGLTPLHLAARAGDEGLCQMLLRGGADTHLADSSGRSPADLAALSGHASLAATLRSRAEGEGGGMRRSRRRRGR